MRTQNFYLLRPMILNHIEGVLIAVVEPRLNARKGRLGVKAVQYFQDRDEQCGPTDRELLEEIRKLRSGKEG